MIFWRRLIRKRQYREYGWNRLQRWSSSKEECGAPRCPSKYYSELAEPTRTVHLRAVRGGCLRRSSARSITRPCEDEHERLVVALNESLEEAGLDARAWTIKTSDSIQRHFGVEYCPRYARQLMSKVGLSSKTARPEYVESDERAQEAFQEGLKRRTI